MSEVQSIIEKNLFAESGAVSPPLAAVYGRLAALGSSPGAAVDLMADEIRRLDRAYFAENQP
ncbi:MAG: hypothetical protein IKT12_06510, partial [Thermoguttaceae bacterium]|nr:hypothetical protein [Thermoguttaceae bacterium]